MNQPVYPNAAIYAHPQMSGAAIEHLCRINGFDREHTKRGNLYLFAAAQVPAKGQVPAPSGVPHLRPVSAATQSSAAPTSQDASGPLPLAPCTGAVLDPIEPEPEAA